MSVLNCISRLLSQGKISAEQADTARKIYNGVIQDDLVRNMDDATREGHAALKTAEILDAAAKAKKVELARRVEAYNSLSERQNAHPDGPVAGFMGLWTRDIRNVASDKRVNVESLRDAHYFPQIAAKMHDADAAYRSTAAGLKQDTIGIRNMVRELFHVKTGDSVAANAAKGWIDATDFGTKTATDLGKVFDTDKDWRLPQFWTSSRVEKAGAKQFKSDMNAEIGKGAVVVIDPETHMVVTGAERDRVLDEATEHIRLDLSSNRGASSIFKQENRVFRFTDGEAGSSAYLRMMDKYGPGQGAYFNMMSSHAQKMSQELATLHVFGPGFKATADQLLADAIKGGREAKLREEDRIKAGGAPKTTNLGEKIENRIAAMGLESEHAAAKLNDYMLGRLSAVGSETVAGFFAGLRAFISMAKLGSATITAVPGDAANWTIASRFRGLDTGRLAADISSHLLTGPGEKEAIATRLGITAHATSRVAIGTKQYGDQLFGNNLSGIMQRMSDFHIRATRLHAYDSAITRAFPMEVMASIGDNAGKSFDEIDPHFKSMFTDYGFTAAEWDKISNGEFLTAGKTKYFMPDSLDGPLRAKLMSAVGDEKQFAYLAGGSSRVHAMTATNDGSILAKASQAFWMFKTFPLSMLATHGMRAAQEGAEGSSAYALQLALFTTIAGAVAVQAQQVLQGKDPIDMFHPIFWASAALKGGALGVYGDLLRDATGTQGNSLAEIAQGPLAGLLGSIGRFTSGASREAQGKKANYGASFADFLRQWTPGSNVWYAQLIWNRMIVDNIQRQLDPSYAHSFERAKQHALKTTGQAFWWAHGDNTPARGPDLGAAVR